MAKIKTSFYCQSCGQDSPKWLGKCPNCGAWNSFAEELVQKEKATNSWVKGDMPARAPQPVRISEVEQHAEVRIDMGDSELNRILGGGLVPGSLILLGGEPGI